MISSPNLNGARTSHEDSLPSYVLIGVVTRDVIPGGFVPGGTVTYAGLTAKALGRHVGVVTSAASDVDLNEVLPGIAVRSVRSPVTTTFENVYTDGRRQQWLRGVASPIEVSAIPVDWRVAPIVHLAPLAAEFGSEVAHAVRGCRLLGVTPQGWLRSWDERGFVRRTAWERAEDVLAIADVVVLSQEDLDGGMPACARLAESARLLVATQGALGCTVFERGQSWQVPGFPAPEVDATGAGDVFAAAFFIYLLDQGDPIAAARYANCVASFSVEAIGVRGIPNPDAVARRLSTAAAARPGGT